MLSESFELTLQLSKDLGYFSWQARNINENIICYLNLKRKNIIDECDEGFKSYYQIISFITRKYIFG